MAETKGASWREKCLDVVVEEGDLSIKGGNRPSLGSNDLIQPESPIDPDLRNAMPKLHPLLISPMMSNAVTLA